MGFFSSLWSGVKKAVKSVAAAVVKVAKAVVRAVPVLGEIGEWAKKTAVAAARRVGAAAENLARWMQGKPRAEVERLCRNLEKMIFSLQRLAKAEIADFAQFARVSVFEDLLPRLVQVVGATKHEDELSAPLRLFALEGLTLLEDPASASDDLLESVELLSEEYLKRAVDAVALERMIIAFDGNREVEEAKLSELRTTLRRAEREKTEAGLLKELGKVPRRPLAEVEREIATLEAASARGAVRVSDLEMVTFASEGLCQGAEDDELAETWRDELAVIQEIVFGFYQRGADAMLEGEERERLHEASVVFRGDAARRPEARETRERVEVGV